MVRRTYLAIPLSLLVLAGCPGACNKPEPSVDATSVFKGESIGIDVPAGLGFKAAWELNLQEWAASTNAEAEMHEFDANSEESLANVATADLIVIPFNRLAEFTEAQTLARIPEFELKETELNWLDIFQGLREKIVATKAGPVAVPLSAPVLVCYYRRDLLQKAGLEPPQSWDAYHTLLEQLESWAPGLSAVEPWGQEYRATMFFARAVAYAQHTGHYSLFFEFETGEPLIDSPGFVRALEAARSDLAKMPPSVLNFDAAECRRRILAGEAALAIAFETGRGNPPLACGPETGREDQTTANGNNPRLDGASTRADRAEGIQVGFCRLPGSKEVYNLSSRAWEAMPEGEVNQFTLTGFGGLCAGVSAKSSSRQAQAAWSLLTTLTLSDMSASLPPPPGTMSLCRESQIAQSDAWVGQELTPSESGHYLDVVARCLRDRKIVAELPLLGHAQFRRSLTENLGKMLAGDLSPQEALKQTAQSWRQISKNLGLSAVRDSYRRSLGLRPLVELK